MQFETTIQYLFDYHPVLFTERWKVLDYLFCVIGNGYEWENGQLIYHENPIDYTPRLAENGRATLHVQHAKKQISDWYEEVEKKRLNKLKEILQEMPPYKLKDYLEESKTIEEYLEKNTVNVNQKERIKEHFKPKLIAFCGLSQYSKIFNLPEDIQPDWLEGAKETARLLLENSNSLEIETKERLENILQQ